MKPRTLIQALTLSAAAGALTLQAQVFTPQSTGGAPASGGGNSSPGQTTVVTQGEDQGGNDPMSGNLFPMFNPGDETVAFEGQLWNTNNNRIFNARFEKYLNTPPADSDEDKGYRAVIEKIRVALSPHQKPNLQEAVSYLEQAARFEQDAMLSDSLANAIYRVWLARKEVQNLGIANERLRQERKVQGRNYTIAAEGSKLKAPAQPKGQGANNQQQQPAQTPQAELSEAAEYVTRHAELMAKITANEGKIAISEIESKLEFQALIVQFFAQRRFEHVIIGARLYTEFFADGAGRIEFKEGSDAEEMFGQTAGFDPTVTTLDTLANEAIRDTSEAVKAFDLLIEKNERASASKRLMEAFAVGEHLPSIRTVALEKKQSIKEFVQEYNQLLSSMESKNFGRADENTKRLMELADDFDDSKPTQVIQTVRVTTSMHIQQAMNEALQGNQEKAHEHIAAATEIWPTNPELEAAFKLMAQNGNMKFQTLNQLDSLIQTKSYRQIFDDKARYLAACADEPQRLADLDQILGNIAKINVAIESARRLSDIGNHFGAWETVEEYYRDFPDDLRLSQSRNDLMTKVASFVDALDKAGDLEERNQNGSSLAWYLKSRQMYPASTYAQEGIDRQVGRILPDNAPLASPPAPDSF